jgi:hypothetical protein
MVIADMSQGSCVAEAVEDEGIVKAREEMTK